MSLSRPHRADKEQPGLFDRVFLYEATGRKPCCRKGAVRSREFGFEVSQRAVLVPGGNARCFEQTGCSRFIAAVATGNAAGFPGYLDRFPTRAAARGALRRGLTLRGHDLYSAT